MKLNRFAIYAWATLVYNLGVILWGAYVRATGAGAGCGAHWPLCKGVVIPREPAIETMIEFSHRVTSGLALISALVLVVWAFRAYPHGHRVRRAATFSLIFMITEALLGAGLVLFEWVAHNTSLARVISMGAHLTNTFLLLAALTLSAWWASGGEGFRFSRQGWLSLGVITSIVGTFIIGITGAVIAFGDTLYYAHLDAGGTEASIAPLVATIKEIRIVHPFVAVLVSIFLLVLAWQAQRLRPSTTSRQLALLLSIFIALQIIAGILNVYWRVPVAMQLIHLLLADCVWITVVLVGTQALRLSAAPDRLPQITPPLRSPSHS